MPDSFEVSVVLPCLNEQASVGICVRKAVEALEKAGLKGEVLVVDNGSTDDSVDIARAAGALVVHEARKGYGSALIRGLKEAKGTYVVMADTDDSYDLGILAEFVQPLKKGADMVIGNRFKGGILPGAMPWKNRYIGNPVLSWVLKVLFKTHVSDAHCGMRSLTKNAFEKLGLRMPGMEFASEMIIKAAKQGLRIEEIPILLYPDRRQRSSHLRPWRDGWQHLKLMLTVSPGHLFLIPGLCFFVVGFFVMLALAPGPLQVGPVFMGPHWMVVGSLLVLLGVQILYLYRYALVYADEHGSSQSGLAKFLSRAFNGERGFLWGIILAFIGGCVDLYVLLDWIGKDFGPLDHIHTAIFGSTLVLVGVQTIFSAFFVDLLRDELGSQ